MVNPLARVIMSNITKDIKVDNSSQKKINSYDILVDKEENILRALLKGNTEQCYENDESQSISSEMITIEQLAEKLKRGE
ncbi:hypothetical protein E8P77_09415 [Soehngenia saccharolytica]|nr:hypothetical protein E8P77_09415 [Soehngenia saccharolytica]